MTRASIAVLSREERLNYRGRAEKPHAGGQALCRSPAWRPRRSSSCIRSGTTAIPQSSRDFSTASSCPAYRSSWKAATLRQQPNQEHQEGGVRHHLWWRPLAHHPDGRSAAPAGPALGLGHIRRTGAAEIPRALRHEQCHAGRAEGLHRQGEACRREVLDDLCPPLELRAIPGPRRDDVAEDLGGPVDILEAQIERRQTQPDDVGLAEIADHTLRDQSPASPHKPRNGAG